MARPQRMSKHGIWLAPIDRALVRRLQDLTGMSAASLIRQAIRCHGLDLIVKAAKMGIHGRTGNGACAQDPYDATRQQETA